VVGESAREEGVLTLTLSLDPAKRNIDAQTAWEGCDETAAQNPSRCGGGGWIAITTKRTRLNRPCTSPGGLLVQRQDVAGVVPRPMEKLRGTRLEHRSKRRGIAAARAKDEAPAKVVGGCLVCYIPMGSDALAGPQSRELDWDQDWRRPGHRWGCWDNIGGHARVSVTLVLTSIHHTITLSL
jgi:hypothetical protein